MVPNPHANLHGVDLHESKRTKEPVRAASTANVSLSTPGAAIDGVTLASGDRILLKDQSAPTANGIYTWTGASAALTRATDASSAADFGFGFQVYVREGTVNGATNWTYTTSTNPPVIGSTSLTFVRISGTGTFSGEIVATDFAPTGLTGATGVVRFVGGTAGGAPVSGTFVTGDMIVDRTGAEWVCTAGGTPGTWRQSGSVISTGVNGQALSILSLTELTTIAAAATTTTAIQIPAGAIVLSVSVRVTVAIPTATTFTVIGNTSTTVFDTAAVSVALNSTDPGTAAGAFYNATAQTIRITPNSTPGTNAGRVRVTITYLSITPPTS